MFSYMSSKKVSRDSEEGEYGLLDVFGFGLELVDLAKAFIPLQYFMWL